MFTKMGFELLAKASNGLSARLKLPGENQVIFEIFSVSEEYNIGIDHIAFLVDDMDQTCEDLKRNDIEIEKGPFLFEASGRTLTNLRDPDGWRLQLTDG